MLNASWWEFHHVSRFITGAQYVAGVYFYCCRVTIRRRSRAGAPQSLPPVVVEAERQPRTTRSTGAQPASAPSTPAPAMTSTTPPPIGSETAEQARQQIQQTPGGVDVVAAQDYKYSSVAATIKDVLEYVPGVFAQPKWGDDTRLSIRGSSLSRNFHLRGIQLYMDGIPINTSDGYGDFQEIDPTAYKYVEVWKGLTHSGSVRILLAAPSTS